MTEPTSSGGLGGKARDVIEESRARHFVVRHQGNVAVDIPLWLFIVFIIFGMPAAVIGIVIAVVAGADIQFTPPTYATTETEEPAPVDEPADGPPPGGPPHQD